MITYIYDNVHMWWGVKVGKIIYQTHILKKVLQWRQGVYEVTN